MFSFVLFEGRNDLDVHQRTDAHQDHFFLHFNFAAKYKIIESYIFIYLYGQTARA